MPSSWPVAFSMIGPSGSTGPTGATGQGFSFRESYNKTISYKINDIVLNNNATQAETSVIPGTADNNTYICIGVNTPSGTAPNSPAASGQWTLFTPYGATGATGVTGVTGLGFTWRGTFNPSAIYNKNDLVKHSDGFTYICKIPSKYTLTYNTNDTSQKLQTNHTGGQFYSEDTRTELAVPFDVSSFSPVPNSPITGSGLLPNTTVQANWGFWSGSISIISLSQAGNLVYGNVSFEYYIATTIEQNFDKFYIEEIRGHTGYTGSTGSTGVTGSTGMGISSAYVDAGGDLKVVYTNTNNYNLGRVLGPTGATGPLGPNSGFTGATGLSGLGFNWRGTFNPSAIYNINDIVKYSDGFTYICKIPSKYTLTYNTNNTSQQLQTNHTGGQFYSEDTRTELAIPFDVSSFSPVPNSPITGSGLLPNTTVQANWGFWSGSISIMYLSQPGNLVYGNVSFQYYIATTIQGNFDKFHIEGSSASGVYTPATPGVWASPVPTSVANAIDRLAQAIYSIDNTPVPTI